MDIKNMRMAGNLYSKTDVDKWMTIPKLSEIPQTSFLDVSKLILFDQKLLGDIETEGTEIDLSEMFEEL